MEGGHQRGARTATSPCVPKGSFIVNRFCKWSCILILSAASYAQTTTPSSTTRSSAPTIDPPIVRLYKLSAMADPALVRELAVDPSMSEVQRSQLRQLYDQYLADVDAAADQFRS